MLPKELRTVYDTLRNLTGDEVKYKVIDADEIIEALPSELKLTFEELSKAIKELKDREYLKLKFFTLEEYCLQIIPREEELIQLVEEINEAKATKEEEQKDEKPKKEKKVKEKKDASSKAMFLAGFLGALVGGILVTIVAVVVMVVM